MITFDYNTSKRQGQLRTTEDILSVVRSHFSVKNDAAAFAKKRGQHFVKDRKYAITPTGLFDFGLYKDIRNFLIEKQFTEIEYTEAFKKHLKCGFINYTFSCDLNIDPRYFQKETVEQCMKVGRGTIIIGTGGGKSAVQAMLIENFKNTLDKKNFKCLIVVPGLSLVSQLNGNFEEYGVSFTHSGWTGKDPLQNTQVVICNSENLNAKFWENPWIMDVDLFIEDEVHKCNSTSNISKLVHKIKTPNKYGFTGTLSDNKLDSWKTIGTFGPIIYEKNSKELRDEEFLSPVSVKIVKLIHPRMVKMKYTDELAFLYASKERNNIIKKLAVGLPNNTLILINHLDHGDNLMDAMKNIEGKEIFFVKGEMPVEERETIVSKMESQNNVVCNAMSSIFSTGINIKHLHNIVFAGLGKSFIRIVQSIGRGLRLHDSKSKLTLLDICDNTKASERHSNHRKTIYDREQIPWTETEIQLTH